MHWLDVVILIPILLALWRGFKRGLILELATLVGLALGIYAGLHFSYYASDLLQSKLEIESEHLPILSFAVTFLVVVIAVFLLGKALERIVKMIALSFFNKLAGALFSVTKVAIIIALLLVIFDRFNSDFEWVKAEELDRSLAYKGLVEAGSVVLPEVKSVIENNEVRI